MAAIHTPSWRPAGPEGSGKLGHTPSVHLLLHPFVQHRVLGLRLEVECVQAW